MNKLCSIILLLVVYMAAGCKKVEKNNEFLHSIYSVLSQTTNLYKTDGSFFAYQYSTPAFKTLVAGDTLSIAGILGGSNAQRMIKIGDSTVQVFGQTQYRMFNKSTGDTIWTDVDYLQCRIPRGTTGNNVSVMMTVNGITIQAPAVKIQQFTDIPSATDTTLVVEKVGEWLPSNPALYNDGYSLIKLWEDGVVTNEGNLWFYNQVEGIFKMKGGSVQQVLANGAQITPANGLPFKIVYIIGFTVDIDETVLYFSASTTDATPDTAGYYITRLCKMDPATGAIEVLNRSTFMKSASLYPRAADLSTPLYDPSYNYLPAEGGVADVRMALASLRLALDGTLFAVNNAYNTTVTPKSPLAGNPRFPQFSDPAWYAQRDSVIARSWYGGGTGNIVSGMGNFIRIRDRQVRSLAKPNTARPVPAMTLFYYSGQQMSPDGRYIYNLGADGVLTVTSTDDFESETKGGGDIHNFSFSSKDTSGITGLHTPSINLSQTGWFTRYYILSNEDAVLFPSPYQGLSIPGINLAAHNVYVFAGTEKGLITNNADVSKLGQTQTTGPAKWVNFSPNRRVLYGTNFFIGYDRKNYLYFANSSDNGSFSNPQYLPLEIYRIKKP